jgi:hypothetical protein
MTFYIDQDTQVRLQAKIDELETLRFEHNTLELFNQVIFWRFILHNSVTLPVYECWEDALKVEQTLENLKGVIIK